MWLSFNVAQAGCELTSVRRVEPPPPPPRFEPPRVEPWYFDSPFVQPIIGFSSRWHSPPLACSYVYLKTTSDFTAGVEGYSRPFSPYLASRLSGDAGLLLFLTTRTLSLSQSLRIFIDWIDSVKCCILMAAAADTTSSWAVGIINRLWDRRSLISSAFLTGFSLSPAPRYMYINVCQSERNSSITAAKSQQESAF